MENYVKIGFDGSNRIGLKLRVYIYKQFTNRSFQKAIAGFHRIRSTVKCVDKCSVCFLETYNCKLFISISGRCGSNITSRIET